ncbi:MAG: hypothetical protein ACOZQL_16750 [Myxococcota bacterium]
MTTISNKRPVAAPVVSSARATTSAPVVQSTSAAATGSSGASSFEASTAAPNTFSGLINQGTAALKDVEGGGSLRDFLSKYPTKSGLEQAKKDLDALRGKLDPDQVTAIENALQAQQVKLGTQSLMNSIAEAVRSALKKEIQD